MSQSIEIDARPAQDMEEELKHLLADAYNNFSLLAKLLFEEDFFAPFTSLHRQIFDLIDHSKAKKIVIAAPRGLGKSTICEALVKRAVLFGDKRFIGYLSNSLTSAELYTENVKMDLMSNQKLLQFGFPPITIGQMDGVPEEVLKMMQFSKKAWVAYGRTLVLPRGAKQQVRGLKWIRYRPDLWVVDDLEDDDEIENEMQREKLRNWFFGAFLKTVSRYVHDHKIIYIDTVKHEDALIQRLLDSPDWESIRLSAYEVDEEGNYITTCPEFIPQDELEAEVASARREGRLDILAREWGSRPIAKEENEFYKNIRYYEETDDKFVERVQYLENFVICDPARTANTKSAESGFLVFGVDVQRNAIYIRQAFGKRLHQNEIYEELFRLCIQYKAQTFGVEVTGLKEHITYPIRNEMVRRRLSYLNFIELNARSGSGIFAGQDGGKVGRAKGLIPLYRQGIVFHNLAGTAELEQQMLSFPRPARWDVLDCAAYIPQVMESGLRYMHPENQVDDSAWLEREYAALQNDDKITFKKF